MSSHRSAYVFCPFSNYSIIQMGILPPHPTVRGFDRDADSRRESLTSLINKMQERLAHSTHLQTSKSEQEVSKKPISSQLGK
jgi:hypothetical protein